MTSLQINTEPLSRSEWASRHTWLCWPHRRQVTSRWRADLNVHRSDYRRWAPPQYLSYSTPEKSTTLSRWVKTRCMPFQGLSFYRLLQLPASVDPEVSEMYSRLWIWRQILNPVHPMYFQFMFHRKHSSISISFGDIHRQTNGSTTRTITI